MLVAFRYGFTGWVSSRVVSEAKEADVHVAGTPCTDFSSRGSLNKTEGATMVPFLAWAAERRRVQEKWILQENVLAFDTDFLSDCLSDLYHVQAVQLDPAEYLWPVVRKRKYTLLKHKFKTGPVTCPINRFAKWFLHCSRQNAAQAVADAAVQCLGSGTGVVAWDMFFVAPPEELALELSWAAGRPKSSWTGSPPKDRNAKVAFTAQQACDCSDGGIFWQVLTANEQKFLRQYAQIFPGVAYSLNQDPNFGATHSSRSHLHCLIKNTGILWSLTC